MSALTSATKLKLLKGNVNEEMVCAPTRSWEGDPISQISEDREVLLPASDQEEEGEDDKEGEATDRCCDDDQHLALIGSDVRR